MTANERSWRQNDKCEGKANRAGKMVMEKKERKKTYDVRLKEQTIGLSIEWMNTIDETDNYQSSRNQWTERDHTMPDKGTKTIKTIAQQD